MTKCLVNIIKDHITLNERSINITGKLLSITLREPQILSKVLQTFPVSWAYSVAMDDIVNIRK